MTFSTAGSSCDFVSPTGEFLPVNRSNLEIVRELGDRAAQGRACGNLGNTHYLLGNFNLAVRNHEEVGSGKFIIFNVAFLYHILYTSTCMSTI